MVQSVLGALRLDLGRPPVDEGGLHFLWVVDFPLFEADDDGAPTPMHHPFTMPHPDDIDRLESDPLSVRAQAYDLVLNGWELGSGSVRIHRPDVQQRIFTAIGIDADGRAGAFRIPARRVPFRRTAARGFRRRHRPLHRDPRGRGEHPRGDRVPEDAVRCRPADRRPESSRPPPTPRPRPQTPRPPTPTVAPHHHPPTVGERDRFVGERFLLPNAALSHGVPTVPAMDAHSRTIRIGTRVATRAW